MVFVMHQHRVLCHRETLLPAIPLAQETVVDSLTALAHFQERALLTTLRDRTSQLPGYWAKGIATVFSSFNQVDIDLSCIGTTFHHSIHHCSFHPHLTSPSVLFDVWFLWPKTCQGYQRLFSPLLPFFSFLSLVPEFSD